LNHKYIEENGDCSDPDNFYPMILCDDANVFGHLILRYTNGDRNTIRFGFVIVDSSRRGEGLGAKCLILLTILLSTFLVQQR